MWVQLGFRRLFIRFCSCFLVCALLLKLFFLLVIRKEFPPFVRPQLGSWSPEPPKRLRDDRFPSRTARSLQRQPRRWRPRPWSAFALRAAAPMGTVLPWFWAGTRFSLASTEVKPSSGCWRTIYNMPPTSSLVMRAKDPSIRGRPQTLWWTTRCFSSASSAILTGFTGLSQPSGLQFS